MFLACSRFMCLLTFLLGALVMGASLFLEYGLGLEPCLLCQIQRYFLLGLCIVNLAAFLHRPSFTGMRAYSIASMVLALGGAGSAVRQVLLQGQAPELLMFCQPDLGAIWLNLPLNVVVYDDQAANYLKDVTLAPEQLEKSVVISQSVDDASAASLEFSHPATFNDEMLGALPDKSDAPVTFFAEDDNGNRSEPLELPAEAFDVDPHAGVITYDLNLFPETPAYAVGSIPLFIADIDKKVLDIAHLPKGLELKGNALIVDQKVFPAEAWRFYAKDDTGNYLKEVAAVSHSSEPDGATAFDVHYFYGQPTQLESYARTALNPVEYGFEVKLDKAPEASTPQ